MDGFDKLIANLRRSQYFIGTWCGFSVVASLAHVLVITNHLHIEDE